MNRYIFLFNSFAQLTYRKLYVVIISPTIGTVTGTLWNNSINTPTRKQYKNVGKNVWYLFSFYFILVYKLTCKNVSGNYLLPLYMTWQKNIFLIIFLLCIFFIWISMLFLYISVYFLYRILFLFFLTGCFLWCSMFQKKNKHQYQNKKNKTSSKYWI